jgi:tripartite-type tricarboxylate transporter receptor subunit TctC
LSGSSIPSAGIDLHQSPLQVHAPCALIWSTLMMKLPRRQFLHLAAGAAALSTTSRVARAQKYPERPVRVVVPYAPGGPTDTITRLLAQKMSEHLSKQFYVENMGGGGGNIAMGRVARMAPDGYTLLMSQSLALRQGPLRI